MSNDTDELFALELVATRAGLPPTRETHGRICSDADRAYMLGVLRAEQRNPTPEQRLERDLAGRARFDPTTEKIELPPDTPPEVRKDKQNPLGIANSIKLRVFLHKCVEAR